MHLQDLERWMLEHGYDAPVIFSTTVAELHDHELAWNYRSQARKAGAANAWPQQGEILPGVVLEVNESTFNAMDHKEGHPNRYSRGKTPLPVETTTGAILQAWVYRVTPPLLCDKNIWPNSHYLGLILSAAITHDLPEWYLKSLHQIPTSDAPSPEQEPR